MGGVNSGTSNDSGGKDTKTPFGKASSTKTKTKFGYTKPPSKLKSFIQGGGVLGHIFSETIGKAAAKSNLKRRQKFISKYNTNVPPSEKINLTDEQILSKDGLSSLKGKGYTTISDRLVTGGNDNNNNNQPILEASIPEQGMEPITAPSNAEITQAQSTDMSADQILLANKKKGRSQTILNSSQGLGSSTTNTTKKTLGA